MTLSRYKLIAVFVMLLIGVMVSEGWTAESTPSRDMPRLSLKGLNVILVGVAELSPKIRNLEITDEVIKTDVEVRLRKAGIRVFTSQDKDIYEKYEKSGRPILQVSMYRVGDERGFSDRIEVQLYQDVILARDKTNIRACTWSYGYAGGNQTARSLRDALGDAIDHFINDYLAVNPK